VSNLEPILAHDSRGRRIRKYAYVRARPDRGAEFNAWVLAIDTGLDVITLMDKKGRKRLARLSEVFVSSVCGNARANLDTIRDAYLRALDNAGERARRARRL
jgi:hypothetical protein